jgi:hypothetical protein
MFSHSVQRVEGVAGGVALEGREMHEAISR